MEMFLICVVVMGAFIGVNSLQCYQCNNCPDKELKDEYLVTCGAVAESTTPATSAPETSAATNALETTTASNASQTSTTTKAPETSTATNTPQTSTATSTPETSTATNASQTSTATSAPETAALENVLQIVRPRRHAPQEIGEINRGCKCNGIPCACDGGQSLGFSQYADATTAKLKTYSCAIISYTVNSTAMVERRCVENGEKEFCAAFQDLVNDTSIECKSCTTDKCNIAYPLQHSVTILLFVLTLTLLTK